MCHQLYIGGRWVPPSSGEVIEVENPATEEVIDTVASAGPEDVGRAVQAARAAFDEWSRTEPAERARFLLAARDALVRRRDALALQVALEVGTPIKVAAAVQVGLPIEVLGSLAELLDTYPFEELAGSSLIVREPPGVVGAITPWNYPLHQAVAKVAAALGAGCTVVLKPSELAPLSVLALAEVFEEAGLPPGVLNIVTGTGQSAGEALAAHDDVDMVSFTGSTRAGRRVAELAARTVKKLALELGGKSANVLLDDADLASAVKVGVANAFLNAGQTCSAWTRMLVDSRRYRDAADLAVEQAAKFTPGDPLDPATRLGPLVSAAQRRRVVGYIDAGVEDGAELLVGGTALPDGIRRGHYVRPTVFAGVTEQMRIAQEEVFGPVLSIISYSDEAEALRLANATMYGLGGAVWSADPERAVAFARGMRTGQVDINGARFNPRAPFGGYRQSGVGRELGRFGLEEYLEVKALQI